MVFNPTFNNISAKSCQSVLLVEETRLPGENLWPAASCWQTFVGTSTLALQLPVQSVFITTKVVNSNTAHVEVYSIQYYVITTIILPVRSDDFRHLWEFSGQKRGYLMPFSCNKNFVRNELLLLKFIHSQFPLPMALNSVFSLLKCQTETWNLFIYSVRLTCSSL
jgi:hypothetical protein